jgi:hypothetical protein
LQDAAITALLLEQEPARQLVSPPGYEQALPWVPSQVPPQAEPSELQEARPPTGSPATGEQVPPLPATLHAWHWPSHEVSQQRPSTQKPLPH